MTLRRAIRLSVNVDHVATLRQARQAPYPDPLEAARRAEAAGAHGITVHLRGDRRHIQEADVRRLREGVRGKLNLEMAPTEEMLRLAVRLRPDQVSLVPERPTEITTEGGLDVVARAATVRRAAEYLRDAGIATSVFLDPASRQLDALAELGPGLVPGFEINTDAYTRAEDGSPRRRRLLGAVARIARTGAGCGFRVYGGHGLTTANVGPIAAVPEIEELNIGHWLVSRAVLVGMTQAVREMRAAMTAGRRTRG